SIPYFCRSKTKTDACATARSEWPEILDKVGIYLATICLPEDTLKVNLHFFLYKSLFLSS
ncbi:MAG: hypothetical protein WCJ54_07945, partial [Actinomycetota bacterium]